jgi:hypothetical protein
MAKQTTKDSGDDEWFRAIHEKDTTRDVSGRNGTGCPVARVVRAGRATLPQAGETAFGGDSAIELLSAVTVLWRFRSTRDRAEARAARITGSLLIALAAYVAIGSLYVLLAAKTKAEPSYIGIALLVAAAIVMPWFGHERRRLAAAVSSGSLRADAVQSSICGYMAWTALAGLLLNRFAHLPSADPVATLGLLPNAIEARESFQGE